MSDLLIDFFGAIDLPSGPERNTNQIACHIFLFTLAAVNVIYLIFIAGFGTGSLRKNFLQQLALMGGLMQLGSCYNSMTRYNIGDEYNWKIANAGAAFGLASGIFNNIALSTIWFYGSNNRGQKWAIFSAIIVLFSVWAMYMELKTYDETHFHYFRLINMQNTPYTGIVCFFTARALKNKKITIDPTIISQEAVTRVFNIMWMFALTALILISTNMTLVIYVGGGLIFGCVNIATFYMGQFDDYYPFSEKSQPVRGVGRETESLVV